MVTKSRETVNGTIWDDYFPMVATVQNTGIWLVPCPSYSEVMAMDANKNMVYGFALLDVLPREQTVRSELYEIGYSSDEVDELVYKYWRREIC
jgi:hypothetical protein